MVRLPYVADVHMAMYHMDRIVFRVELSHDVSWRTWQDDIPPFYRGFEVGVWKKSTEQDGRANRSEPVSIVSSSTSRAAHSDGLP